MTSGIPRLFILRRDHDVTGVSGPGDIANGVQWPDGTVALRWLARPSISIWDSLEMMLSVHGHDGATRVVWLYDATIPMADHLEAANRAQVEIQRLRSIAGRAYLLADRWEAAHGEETTLVRAAGVELRETLDADATDPCERADRQRHYGFTCAEVDQSTAYWTVRWQQEEASGTAALTVQRAIAADLRVENRALRAKLQRYAAAATGASVTPATGATEGHDGTHERVYDPGPLSGVEVRDPCPYCEGCPLIPRVLMDGHVRALHPEVRERGPKTPMQENTDGS